MTDLAGCAGLVTPAPPPNQEFDPRAWLSSFKDAGGWWCVIGGKPHLGAPTPPNPDPIGMLNGLSPGQKGAVLQLLASSNLECSHGER
jgi:hypothetical protein